MGLPLRKPLLDLASQSIRHGAPQDPFVAVLPRGAVQTRFIKGRATAAHIVGPIEKNVARLSVTVGHTDLVHVLLYIVDGIGPCDVLISTWDVARKDIDLLAVARDSGRARSIRWKLDEGFKRREAGVRARIVEVFGAESVRESPNHAKALLIGNEAWFWVVLTSANICSNPREEHYVIYESEAMYRQLLEEWVEPSWKS